MHTTTRSGVGPPQYPPPGTGGPPGVGITARANPAGMSRATGTGRKQVRVRKLSDFRSKVHETVDSPRVTRHARLNQ